MTPTGYNNNFQLVQAAGYVVIFNEQIHDARIIPLDGRPHLPQNVRQWMGDSRGHWEGSTLVIDTSNFTGKANFRGSGENMHLTERFTRMDMNNLKYEITVDDPGAYTATWSTGFVLRWSPGQELFEYVCQDNNHAPELMVGAQKSVDRSSVIIP